MLYWPPFSLTSITADIALLAHYTGAAPFGDTEKMSKFEVFNNINGMTVRYPMFMSGALKALLGGLLERNAARRLSFPMVKASKWLAGVGTLQLLWGTYFQNGMFPSLSCHVMFLPPSSQMSLVNHPPPPTATCACPSRGLRLLLRWIGTI